MVPIIFTHNNHQFASDEGVIKYNGVPDETHSRMLYYLTIRPDQYRRGKWLTWPPKSKPQKWFRAMCAFRELDPQGAIAEVQERLKAWLKAEKDGSQNKRDEVVANLGAALSAELNNALAAAERKIQAEEERNGWAQLSATQKIMKDCLRFLREDAFDDGKPDAYAFNARPRFIKKNIEELKILAQDRGFTGDVYPQLDKPELWPQKAFGADRFCFVFTAPVEEGRRYSRGRFHGDGWLDDGLIDDHGAMDLRGSGQSENMGKTWVGSGFEKGIIVGRTEELVREKIHEISNGFEAQCITSFLKKNRRHSGIFSMH